MARDFTSKTAGVADPTANTITAYTLAGWVKWTGAQHGNIVTGTDASGATVTWSHQLRMMLDTGVYYFESYAFDGSVRVIRGTTHVAGSTYYHVATTVANGQPMKLYVNGVLEATSGFSIGTLYTGLDRWAIGGSSSGTLFWAGPLAEMALFRSALSGSDIASLAAGSVTPLGLGAPRWYLPLCGTGAEADASGNGLALTFPGGTPSADTHPSGIANVCGFPGPLSGRAHERSWRGVGVGVLRGAR